MARYSLKGVLTQVCIKKGVCSVRINTTVQDNDLNLYFETNKKWIKNGNVKVMPREQEIKSYWGRGNIYDIFKNRSEVTLRCKEKNNQYIIKEIILTNEQG